MTIKDRFENLRAINTEIEEQLQEIYRLKELAKSTTIDTSKENVQSSGDKDILGRIMAMVVDREREVDELIDGLVKEKQELKEVLNQLTNPRYIDAVYLRYFWLRSYKEIAMDLRDTYLDDSITSQKIGTYIARAFDVLERITNSTRKCG